MLVFAHDGPQGGAQDILVNVNGKSPCDTVGEADDQATIYTTPWDNVGPSSEVLEIADI
jgi:hypothetical protein